MKKKQQVKSLDVKKAIKGRSIAVLEDIHKQVIKESENTDTQDCVVTMVKTKKKAIEEERIGEAKKAKTEENIEKNQPESMIIQEEETVVTTRCEKLPPLMENCEKEDKEDKHKNTNNNSKSVKKEIVMFKDGKPINIENNSELNREKYLKDRKKFDGLHRGPYVVTATLNNECCTTRSQSNFLKIMNAISEGKHGPDKVVKSGFKSVDLFFNSLGKANKILSDSKLNSKINCEILNRNKNIRGVITDWDGSIHSLGEAIDNKTNIISLERMLKRSYNKTEMKTEMKHTNSFIIVFNDRTIPDYVSLYNGLVKIRVRTYISAVKQCFKCYRFGHIKAMYKSKDKICVVCSEGFHGFCDREEKCVNCGEKQSK